MQVEMVLFCVLLETKIFMSFLTIETMHIQRVKSIWDEYGHKVTLPAADAWKFKSDDEIWLRVVGQVVVVGGAESAKKLKTPSTRGRISWSRLSQMTTGVENEIWGVLREIGTRYAGKSSVSCRKTKAICRNLLVLKKFKDGPIGFMRKISEMESSEDKIDFVVQKFSYIKQKGARDFLTSGFGLVQDRIALDTRVLKELKQIGIKELPDKTPGDAEQYRAIEEELVTKICSPLGISGAQLDQLLFNLVDYRSNPS